MEKDIIEKLKESGLKGRSGSGFPTGLKWETVKNTIAYEKYVVCNASEGEPGIFKDGFILENYPEEVVEGIKIALETINSSSAFFYLRKDYFKKFRKKLEKLAKGLPFCFVEKPEGYIAGEETSICEVIEGKRPEPRIKPPYPAQSGVFNCPTLINNVETFYFVSKIAKGEYEKTRFFSVSKDVKKQGTFELPEDYFVLYILKKTGNLPDFDFFVQVGGGACGEFLLKEELNGKVSGAGSIIVYNSKKTNLMSLAKKLLDFHIKGNCDKCIPCREGSYRINEMILSGKIDKNLLEEMLFNLEKASFCPLGKGMAVPLRGLFFKLIK